MEQTQDHISLLQSNINDICDAQALAAFFKAFGDSTRLLILHALSRGECCVSELASSLDMTQSAVSHQLQLLRQNRLVKYRREGKQIYYSLDDDHVYAILAAGIEHISET